MSDVVIVDSGVANLASILAAINRLGVSVTTTADPRELRAAQRLVIPGVGAFGTAMASLRSRGLDLAIRDAITGRTPVLAICLGLQVLAKASDESPGIAGLGILDATCRRLPDESRVPQLGWNVVMPDEVCRFVRPMNAAYANSYALESAPAGWDVAWTTHGRRRFVAAIERDMVLGCQFHPELSGTAGAELIRRWFTGASGTETAVWPGPRTLMKRIVPCLDVRDGRVVKGIRFSNMRDAGDPATQAALYERQGADEVVMLDIAASPMNRATQVETVRQVRRVLGIPLTVGGGVRSVADARRLLAAGADKVSVNSAAVARPELLSELAEEFGVQCVVLAIDARRRAEGWDVLTHGGRRIADGLDAVGWARAGAAFGAGEVLLTSWDRDGTRAGCDLVLVRVVSDAVRVPVIASGGIGTRADVADALVAGADAVLAASVFHDGDETVESIKADLASRGVAVRR